jgi:hypothetical protein
MLKTEASLLDLQEASRFLGVSETTVIQLALEGSLRISTIRPTPCSRSWRLLVPQNLVRF